MSAGALEREKEGEMRDRERKSEKRQTDRVRERARAKGEGGEKQRMFLPSSRSVQSQRLQRHERPLLL